MLVHVWTSYIFPFIGNWNSFILLMCKPSVKKLLNRNGKCVFFHWSDMIARYEVICPWAFEKETNRFQVRSLVIHESSLILALVQKFLVPNLIKCVMGFVWGSPIRGFVQTLPDPFSLNFCETYWKMCIIIGIFLVYEYVYPSTQEIFV